MVYKVSVVMPIYNNENTLSEAIEAILNQSIYSLELILIDDGSTDASAKMCEEYAKAEPLIVEYISQPKSGFGVARNKGLQKAKGDFVYFASAENQFDYKMLEANIALAEERGADLVVFGFKDVSRISLDGSFYHLPKIPHLSSQESFRNHYRNFHHFSPYVLHNKIYRRKFLFENRLRFYQLPLQEAAFFNLSVYKNIGKVAFNRTSYCQKNKQHPIESYQEHQYEMNIKRANAFEKMIHTWGVEQEFQDLILLEYFQVIYLEIKNLSRPSNPMTIEEQERRLQTILENEQIQDVLNHPVLFKNQSAFKKGLILALQNKNSKLALQLVAGRNETKRRAFKRLKWLRKKWGR